MVHKQAGAHHVFQHDSTEFLLFELDIGGFEMLPLYLLIPESVTIVRRRVKINTYVQTG